MKEELKPFFDKLKTTFPGLAKVKVRGIQLEEISANLLIMQDPDAELSERIAKQGAVIAYIGYVMREAESNLRVAKLNAKVKTAKIEQDAKQRFVDAGIKSTVADVERSALLDFSKENEEVALILSTAEEAYNLAASFYEGVKTLGFSLQLLAGLKRDDMHAKDSDQQASPQPAFGDENVGNDDDDF